MALVRFHTTGLKPKMRHFWLKENTKMMKETPRPEKPGVQLFLYSPGRPFALKSLFHHNLHPLHNIFLGSGHTILKARHSQRLHDLSCAGQCANSCHHRGLHMEHKRLPMSQCHRDFKDWFSLETSRGYSNAFGAHITKHVCNQCSAIQWYKLSK